MTLCEHPFAPYVRLLGKGPNLSRALTQAEARTAMGMVLAGAVAPEQLGAFLCLLRIKTETPEEIAGLAQAIRDGLPAKEIPKADVDWPSYAGKARRLPYYLLAALALAGSGIRVFMHGAEHHTAGRVYPSEALAALGLSPAIDWSQAHRFLESGNFAYMMLERISPPAQKILDLKPLLGLRSPLHTVARMINPTAAPLTVSAVTHPPYLPVHQQASVLLGERTALVFKGDGGEVERRPEKPCEVWSSEHGVTARTEWPALLARPPERDDALDLNHLPALWRGEREDAEAETIIAGTMAIILHHLGKASTPAEAETAGRAIWQGRDRSRVCRFTR